MNKYIVILIILIISSTGLQAQRLIKGQKGFEITAGLISDKMPLHNYFYVQAGMTINEKKGNYQLWMLEYSKKTHEFENYVIPVETYSAEWGYSFYLIGDWAKNISLNLGVDGVVGYESFNRGEDTLSNGAVIQNKDSFIYGGSLRLSLETYLADHFVFLLQGKTKAVWGTSVERFRPSTGIGLRYIF
ncbi:conjugal transfer protein TraO [Chryseobacterium sp. ISL-6]|uniref:conjugal transfer protein TraO n=1 Tax=Chryseobacterium sp. ISL-6 TaxID=2819143 RepID=UPI001BEC9883|nr:conjugal transfer protein TraO [Chryseobacterium sp. ISL-6]MBT2621896.1 conjugal transfer protein TraO [Chryseobacterium sp. ISL-6]